MSLSSFFDLQLLLAQTYVKHKAPKVKQILLQTTRGDKIEFKGDTVPSPYSLKVRDEFIPRIDIELG